MNVEMNTLVLSAQSGPVSLVCVSFIMKDILSKDIIFKSACHFYLPRALTNVY